MTEAEKRKLALSFMAAEQNRLNNHYGIVETAAANLNESLRRTAHRRQTFASLAQNGISWDELKAAYDKAYEEGQAAMITFRLSFFYSGTALAYHEKFNASPEATTDFITDLARLMQEEGEKKEIVQHCLEQIGVDTSSADIISARQPSTRKDITAIERMQKSGITHKDLEYERKLGFQNGWNADFYLSACFAAVALLLHRRHELSAVHIEQFLDRIRELEDEEISADDILERAKDEAGVDVSKLADCQPSDLSAYMTE